MPGWNSSGSAARRVAKPARPPIRASCIHAPASSPASRYSGATRLSPQLLTRPQLWLSRWPTCIGRAGVRARGPAPSTVSAENSGTNVSTGSSSATAVLDQQHHAGGHHRLGHRVEPVDAVAVDGSGTGQMRLGQHLPMLRDAQRGERQLAPVDQVPQPGEHGIEAAAAQRRPHQAAHGEGEGRSQEIAAAARLRATIAVPAVGSCATPASADVDRHARHAVSTCAWHCRHPRSGPRR